MEVNSFAQNVVIYKAVQTCNLDCSYCYVYNRGDDSWKSRPKISSLEVSKKLAERLLEHYNLHKLKELSLEIHGGEPLLLGKKRFKEHIEVFRNTCESINLNIFFQTNGLLLDEEWVDLLFELKIPFSISIDGPPEVNDIHRIYKNQRGSGQELYSIIKRFQNNEKFKSLIQGYLSVINPNYNGSKIFDWFNENDFKKFDFLIPDGNYHNPPSSEPDYILKVGGFLIKAFDKWLELESEAPTIRFFETAVKSKTGLKPSLDALGGDMTSMCVIESDGSIGCHDVLRICGGIYSKDKLNINEFPLGIHPDFFNLEKIQKPNIKCKSCKHFNSCSGGYLPHRFDGSSFDNPSYYCDGLYSFFEHVEERLIESIPDELWKTSCNNV